MTTANPFVQPNGSTTPVMDNPFLQPSSGNAAFPKVDQLFGRLVIMKCHKIEVVAKSEKFANKPGETEDRATVDLAVLDGPTFTEGKVDGMEIPATFEGMWINQQSLVGALRGSLKTGQPVLGRIWRFPTKDSAAKYPTRQAIEEGFQAYAARGGLGDKPGFTWKLDQYTDEELATAMAWLKANPNFL